MLLSNQSIIGLIVGAVCTGILLIGVGFMVISMYLKQGSHHDAHMDVDDHSEHEHGVEMGKA